MNKNFRVFFRTRASETTLHNSIVIDNRYSDEELRHEICETMGSSNWFETLNHFNEMVESRNNDISMMESELLNLNFRN